MLKQLSMCAALLVLGAAGVNAQQLQHEAVLQKVDVPGAGFDIVLAMPKSPGGARIDFRGEPDPLIVYLAGGELAMAADGDLVKAFKDLGALQFPAAVFHVERSDKSRDPIAVYVIPNSKAVRNELPGQAPTRIEVPGADFDIVVSTNVGTTIKSEGQIDPLDAGLWPTQVYLVPKAETVGSAMK